MRNINAMNKNDLIDAVAERTSLAKSDAARAVEAVLGAITDTLQKGDAVTLSGFGTFAVKTRAARTGRNPAHRRGDPDRRQQGAGLQGWKRPEGCSKLTGYQ